MLDHQYWDMNRGSNGREVETADNPGEPRKQRSRRSDGNRHRQRSKSRDGICRRNEKGQYVETVTEEDILELVSEIPGPVITTTDVADAFDITTEGARRKLNDLCESEVMNRRKTGQTRIYWSTDSDGGR